MTQAPVTVTLARTDWYQILDGLDQRAERWEDTARYLRDEPLDDPETVIEECSDEEEADQIAAHYRAIIANINHQLGAQKEGAR